MQDPTSNEQIPTPCNGCGAPMREHYEQGGSLLVCSYCGQKEPLPPDHQARAEFLRGRLRNLASAKIRVQGIALLVSNGVRRRMVMGYVLTAVVLVGLYSTYGVVAFLQQPLGIRLWLEGMGAHLTMFILPLLFVGVLVLGYFGAFVYARVKIRPLFAARMPTAPGQQLTCRCCGGALPEVRDAFIDCRYCGGQNFVTSKVANAVARGAYVQTIDYSTRADQATMGLQMAASPKFFYVIYGVVMVGFAVVAKWLNILQ